MSYADREGQLAVQIAREAIEARLLGRTKRPFEIPKAFEEKSGAFVTINTHPAGDLRGCIGYPQPFFPLVKSIEKAAESAATEDPRFPPMRHDELDRVTVEVSILTPPKLVEVKKPKELPARVMIGVDGLSVAQGAYRGILLPQVAVEEGFDAADFLSQACMKAGLLADAWLDPETRVYTFQAEVFAEVDPRGPVVRRNLEAAHASH
ncbi:MAG: TIGR00296 family protein [Thermoplasmata archaeon]